jgi:hypothetical protein
LASPGIETPTHIIWKGLIARGTETSDPLLPDCKKHLERIVAAAAAQGGKSGQAK